MGVGRAEGEEVARNQKCNIQTRGAAAGELRVDGDRARAVDHDAAGVEVAVRKAVVGAVEGLSGFRDGGQ